MTSTPNQRVLAARVAAYTRWSQCDDPTAATAKARTAFLDRFDRQVDPEGKLPPAVRARRAEQAKKAYFLDLARRSAKARRERSANARGE